MATFVTLVNFTDQGIRNIKESPERLEAFKALAEKLGLAIKSIDYTIGHYEMFTGAEGPEAAAVSVLLKLGSLGNVRTQTLRAYSADEMKKIIAELP